MLTNLKVGIEKEKQRSTKHTHKTKDRVTRTPLNYLHTISLKIVWSIFRHCLELNSQL